MRPGGELKLRVGKTDPFRRLSPLPSTSLPRARLDDAGARMLSIPEEPGVQREGRWAVLNTLEHAPATCAGAHVRSRPLAACSYPGVLPINLDGEEM